MVSTYALGMALLVVAIILLCLLVIVPPRAIRLGLRSFERQTGTPPGAVVAASLLGLGVLTLGIAGPGVGTDDFGIVDGLLSVAGALGPLAVAVGMAGRRMRSRLDAASDCSTGNPDTGVVAVDGAVQAVDGTVAVPGMENGVLSCAYVFQKDHGFATRSPAWASVAEGERTNSFAVDDGSGELRVDHGGVSIHSGRLSRRSYSIDLPEGEPVPDDVAAFLSTVGVDAPNHPDADHRLRLRPLTSGDTVTVVGEYERVTKPGEAFWGISDGEGQAYLLPGDLDSVRSRLARRSTWLTGVGVVLSLVGVGYVAAPFVL